MPRTPRRWSVHMSERMPRITGRQAKAAIKRDGWFEVRQQGGHRHVARSAKPGVVTVPMHAGKILDVRVLKSIIEQAGLTVDEFKGLL